MARRKIVYRKLTKSEYMDAQYDFYVRDYKKKSKRNDPLSDMLSKEDYLIIREQNTSYTNSTILNSQFYKIQRSTAIKVAKALNLKGYKELWTKGIDKELRSNLSLKYSDLIASGMSTKEAAAMTYDIWYADSP